MRRITLSNPEGREVATNALRAHLKALTGHDGFAEYDERSTPAELMHDIRELEEQG